MQMTKLLFMMYEVAGIINTALCEVSSPWVSCICQIRPQEFTSQTLLSYSTATAIPLVTRIKNDMRRIMRHQDIFISRDQVQFLLIP